MLADPVECGPYKEDWGWSPLVHHGLLIKNAKSSRYPCRLGACGLTLVDL